MACAGSDARSGALWAALQNPALGLLTPKQQDLFGRLHGQLITERKRRATRGDGLDDVDTGKAGSPIAVSFLLFKAMMDVSLTACCKHRATRATFTKSQKLRCRC